MYLHIGFRNMIDLLFDSVEVRQFSCWSMGIIFDGPFIF